ncbi:cutinase family protein [Mycolicibacterium bacteremicum]|uniref:Cutinase family protein n=1 Tax=Mycolicibacterium bacteremicum TaxID=564198 RepID=A0A1W9Z4W2_MYCBA|nr:cutinase family protein [Mycolicibacterium bacteremicum]MCV7433664.1 cutinase family protein [Mycolicibacterium bacteremicum]ORA07287.1 cutinase family protein [Mycolicibacterium bacteremicum]
MGIRRSRRLLVVGALVASGFSIGAAPAATAQPCPDAEIVFARGSDEPPGVGSTGQAFIDAVRAQSPGRSIDAYAVNYPATGDFDNRAIFPSTMFDGVADAGARLRTTAANCPDTKFILGGFSQGAAVAAYVSTSDLPAAVSDRIAGVVLFGKPTPALLGQYGAPAANIGAQYAGRSLDLCAPGDNICDGSPGSLLGSLVHVTYPVNGLVAAAASAAAGRLA